ncbi:response regulator transcription factor [Actinoalloteichus hymeniacidonis]|uniref:Two component transcriptional regulator, LuxR family n=1 Tax=Actinoalloteichus hymeniacidonis TaxID=340345 RepID=A0AAC9HN01_9PSEU|nr:response regulator transcription factor [Actinoalloteichus hymeniacidonis]AOS61701.1 two component transcriptional regulator, LuxR family [Actinoalloteichus hymeniacidonis]MBB5910281.1 DNA-binding NarL/FixJ family response regulator [Actinoalloteichus hymeniacidonis]
MSAEAGDHRRPLTVALAEDSVLLRDGLVHLLERTGHEVSAAVGTATELVAAVTAQRPDLVLTDVRMPPDHSDEGLRAAIALRAATPNLPILVLSQYIEQTYAAELFADGGPGLGYLLKDRVGDVREFISAVQQVASGGTVVDQEVVRQLLSRNRTTSPVTRLSAREHEVLGLMAQGHANPSIARMLTVSEAAVAKHIGNIMAKLDLPPQERGHRRVLAVLAYLRSQGIDESGAAAGSSAR